MKIAVNNPNSLNEVLGNPFARIKEFFDDPRAQALTDELTQSLYATLMNFPGKLEGIDRNSEGGTFIRHGIEEKLINCDPSLNFEVDFHGWVTFNDPSNRIALGHIHVPYESRWAQQSFINTNNLADIPEMTFVPYRCFEYLSPKNKDRTSDEVLIFSGRQRLGAEIAMCLDGLKGYMEIARIIKDEASYRPQAIRANIDDAIAICDYTEILREDLNSLMPNMALDLTKLSLGKST